MSASAGSRVDAAAGPSTLALVRNFVLFQIGWFAAVMLAARAHPWSGVLAIAVIVAIHLALSAAPLRELRLLCIATLIGLVWDSLVVNTGWQGYVSGQFVSWIAPGWIIAMWTLFGTLLAHSLRWLRGRPLLSAAFGLVGGPLAWYSGARLGAVLLPNPLAAMALQGVGWALLTPWLIHLGRSVDGRAVSPESHNA